MCIGYCHQIQCDVIMLCDNLLMITTGMEISLSLHAPHVKHEIPTTQKNKNMASSSK